MGFRRVNRGPSAPEIGPLQTICHAQNVFLQLGNVGAKVVRDALAGNLKAREHDRAAELREAVTEAGPAYMKLAQALSVRPDLLPLAYIQELQQLQDTSTLEFSKEDAKVMLEETIGGALEDVFDSEAAFERPVACASVGQVYRARLKGEGEEVAVKVQRPGVYKQAQLDIQLIRGFLQLSRRMNIPIVKDQAESLISVVDSWADSFFQEVDYLAEADNMQLFEESMDANQMVSGAIKVPRVYFEFTSSTVLVTEWVAGEKFSEVDFASETNGSQGKAMVNLLLNSYLVQLFEGGLLHADPHPGNFLRLPDNRVAILDFGLTATVLSS